MTLTPIQRIAKMRADIDFQRALVGPGDPSVLRNLAALAIGLGAADEQAEALSLSREVLASQRAVLGAKHPETLATRFHVALLLIETEQFDPAVRLCELLVHDCAEALDPDHMLTLEARWLQFVALKSSGNTKRAATLGKSLVLDMRRVWGADHLKTLGLIAEVNALLEQSGQVADARTSLRDSGLSKHELLSIDPQSKPGDGAFQLSQKVLSRMCLNILLWEQTLAAAEALPRALSPSMVALKSGVARARAAIQAPQPSGRG